jgi:transaldolase
LESKVWNVCPEESLEITDPAQRIVRLAIAGYPQLAADSILDKEYRQNVDSIVHDSIKGLEKKFQDGSGLTRRNSMKALLELSLNLVGMERNRASFLEEQSRAAVRRISEALQAWEAIDSECVRDVIDQILREMKMVLSGKGMVAKMADEIEALLSESDRGKSFVEASKKVIQGNIYYQIVDRGLSKFGNDSATGLRWARHLGAVQVSSNPVIAARAFEEIPDLWKKFESLASSHSEWSQDPERFADEIALFGTVVSLLPNILDFRPIALLSDFKDGMVSIQLNPRKANSVEESLKDALKFHSILKGILERYDAFLSPRYHSTDNTRPNIVFKVSTIGPESIKLTETLDELGIGTNNTVTFTVSQEVDATIAAMKGLATARKSGIPITTIYITNMEGRLEDHLREEEGSRLLREALEKDPIKETRIAEIIQKIGGTNEIRTLVSFDQKVSSVCGKKFLKSLLDEWFVEAVSKEQLERLKQTEADIRMSGILVTRKVYQLLFRPDLKHKLMGFVANNFQISDERASSVVSSIDLLPASKRRAEDTYLVLGDRALSNLTNTEFPDHQLKVLQRSRESGFNLLEFENSIAIEPNSETLARLLKFPDFVKAYELAPSLAQDLNAIGERISEPTRGIEAEQWSYYGPARKTMEEFTNAYDSFRTKLVGSIARPVAAR